MFNHLILTISAICFITYTCPAYGVKKTIRSGVSRNNNNNADITNYQECDTDIIDEFTLYSSASIAKDTTYYLCNYKDCYRAKDFLKCYYTVPGNPYNKCLFKNEEAFKVHFRREHRKCFKNRSKQRKSNNFVTLQINSEKIDDAIKSIKNKLATNKDESLNNVVHTVEQEIEQA